MSGDVVYITSPDTRYFTRPVWYVLRYILSVTTRNSSSYTQLFNVTNFTGQDPFGSHNVVADVCMHASENNIKGCEFVLEEAIICFWCHNSMGI
jgi:hypothetical protein